MAKLFSAGLLLSVRSMGLKLGQDADEMPYAEPPVCQCKNWAWAYYHWEMNSVYRPGYESLPDYNELNQQFFNLQNHSYCIKKEFTQEPEKVPYPGSWCFVSAACEELNGGKKISDYAAAKICGADDDKLSDLNPREVISVTGMIEDPQAAILMAYPWVGASEMEGTNLLKFAGGSRENAMLLGGQRAPTPFVVGNAERKGFLTIIGRNGQQHWEVGNTAADMDCVHGCSAREAR